MKIDLISNAISGFAGGAVVASALTISVHYLVVGAIVGGGISLFASSSLQTKNTNNNNNLGNN